MLKTDPQVNELMATDPETKMEKLISAKTLEILYKYCGKPRYQYDKSKPA
uniref:RNA-dependent RNA polymerase n=1 Tax=Shrew picobirnavirus 4 TaxID=3139563 RepID=A0AB38ZK41_9VIRU